MDPARCTTSPERVEDLGTQDVTTSGKGVERSGSYQTTFSGVSAVRMIVIVSPLVMFPDLPAILISCAQCRPLGCSPAYGQDAHDHRRTRHPARCVVTSALPARSMGGGLNRWNGSGRVVFYGHA
jgi:hypothetical protein